MISRPQLRNQALQIFNAYDAGPLFSPPTLKGRIEAPGQVGGASWAGAGVDPRTGILYVPSVTKPWLDRIVENTTDVTAYRGVVHGIKGPQGLPLVKPPYARVTAIDLNTGDHVVV